MTDNDFSCPILAKGQTCTPCEELAAIGQEIAPVNPKHTLIYGRMNYAHDPLTSKLPAEIVGQTFTHFLPADVDSAYGVSVRRPSSHHRVTNPLSLGAVCTAWRAIAWSTPELWTSITLCLEFINEERVTLLRDWLNRSGELPLYIRIYEFVDLKYMNDTALVKETLNIFTLHAHKWFYFEYNIRTQYTCYLNSSFARAHILNTLEIGINGTSEINLGMVPNLRNLHMEGPWVDYLSGVDWQKLTKLEAKFSSIDTCLRILSEAPYLEDCTFSFEDDNTGTARKLKIVQHDRLLFLNIRNMDADSYTFLDFMQFPALQQLGVMSFDDVAAIIADFLRRSKCPLKILRVNHLVPEATLELFAPLADIPSLKDMELRHRGARLTIYSMDDLRAFQNSLCQAI